MKEYTIMTTNITPETKQNRNFNHHLAKIAVADADHDLGISTMLSDSNNITAYNNGLPSSITQSEIKDEASTLASVFITIGGVNIHPPGKKSVDILSNAFYNVVNVSNSPYDTQTHTECEIGFINDNIPEKLFDYDVCQFIMDCPIEKPFKNPSGETEKLTEKACKANFGKNFAENTKLGGNGDQAAIVVDFSQHHFMEKLVEGDRSEFSVHYLMTPEVVNDPAGKPNVHNRDLFGHSKGVRLHSYVQTSDDKPVVYTRYDEDDTSSSNNFFSNYNFKLSPITHIFTKQKAEKLITNLNIMCECSPGQPLTSEIVDSKGENSISTVMSYIKKLTEQLKEFTDAKGAAAKRKMATLQFNFNTKIQQKRGGDWFQALSCHDVKYRNFTEILPNEGRGFNVDTNCPVYLVTHDRIAVSYALTNGINVIYLDYYGRIFVFKNKADKSFNFNETTSLELIMSDKLKMKRDDILLKMSTAEIYQNRLLPDITNIMCSKFKEECTNIIKTLNELDGNKYKANPNNYINYFTKYVADLVQRLFYNAVSLMFFKNNFYDISESITFMQENVRILEEGYVYNAFDNEIIKQFSRHLSIISSIYDKIGDVSKNLDYQAVNKGIQDWIIGNSKKLDAYRTAKSLLQGSGSEFAVGDEVFDYTKIERALTLEYTEQNRSTDIYIFLPFIRTLRNIRYGDNNDKSVGFNDIFMVLKVLSEKTVKFSQIIPMKERSGRPSTGIILYNRICSLIYETLLFLDNDILDNDIGQKVSVITETAPKTSSDVIVIGELNDIRTSLSGKLSSTTEEVKDESVVGGSTYQVFANSRNLGSVICDTSIRQVYETILTANLLESTTLEKPVNKMNTLFNPKPSTLTSTSRGGKYISLGNILHKLDIASYKDIKSMNSNIMSDKDFVFHPMLPLYMLLLPFYHTLSRKYESHPFYYTYIQFYNVLKKMYSVLSDKYKIKTNANSILSSYFVGYALRTMLFTSHTCPEQQNILENTIYVPKTFLLQCDCFANAISGAIHLNPMEKQVGVTLLESNLFQDFLKKDVELLKILADTPKPTEIKVNSARILKSKVFKLIEDISSKMLEDLKSSQTPAAVQSVSTTSSTTSSSSSSPSPVMPPRAPSVKKLSLVERPLKEERYLPKPIVAAAAGGGRRPRKTRKMSNTSQRKSRKV